MQQDVFMVYAEMSIQIKEHLLEQQCMSGFLFLGLRLGNYSFHILDPTRSYTCSSPRCKLSSLAVSSERRWQKQLISHEIGRAAASRGASESWSVFSSSRLHHPPCDTDSQRLSRIQGVVILGLTGRKGDSLKTLNPSRNTTQGCSLRFGDGLERKGTEKMKRISKWISSHNFSTALTQPDIRTTGCRRVWSEFVKSLPPPKTQNKVCACLSETLSISMQRGMMPITAAAHEETHTGCNPPSSAPLVLSLTISPFMTVQFGTHSVFKKKKSLALTHLLCLLKWI